MPAFQAMLTLTFIAGFSAFMLAGFYMFAKTMNRNLTLLAAFLIVDFMASKPLACTCMRGHTHTDVITLTAMYRSILESFC